MITHRNKLNFVTIQWLWFLCLILAALNSSNTWMHYADAIQPQFQQQQQQLKSTLQLQQEVKSNGPQQQRQQDVTVRNFSPRIDYNNNEWRPVGRGDPLKNDPTFDYSPPTLDRVRYWADSEKDKEKSEEVSAALIDSKLKKANPGKNEILLLGVTGDRTRGGGGSAMHQHVPGIMKNSKGETPLLQPKYTSIRRSYYAHQLPTHLMPPPMHSMIPATQQNQLHSSQIQMQSSQQQQQPQAMHIVKPAQTEYRHNMPGHSYLTSSPMNSMNSHSKHYFMSTATQPWMLTSNSPSMGTSPSLSSAQSSIMMSNNLHRHSHAHSHGLDSHPQDTVNFLSYHNRASLASTPAIMLGMNGMNMAANSIRGSSSGNTLSPTSSRKPWIHDLLQKEFIKPVISAQSPNSYSFENKKPSHMEPQYFEPIARPQGISTTYAPVTFITTTMPSTISTTPTIYITSTTKKQTTSTSHSPMYSSTPPTTTTHVPRTTTTFSPTRLLIPNTSNLAYRPTVAPLKMTTDSLFSHYNQPEKPLRGPMYLIIEGHSKVKTYGKDELDPHKPKIVPIIPKREPVVRMADPSEKRGTPETFQVKHLHTSTFTSSTTTMKPTKQMKTTIKNPTVKPKTIMKLSTTTATKAKELKSTIITSTTTTAKPTTSTKSTMASATKPKLDKNLHKEITNLGKADNEMKMVTKIFNPNALDALEKPSHQATITEPSTGMQGFLSLLDSSLDSIFKNDAIEDNNNPKRENNNKDLTTKLKSISMKTNEPQQQIAARVSTKLQPIKAEDYDDDYVNDNYFKITTEYLPRETRQIFDYDQLPQSRIDLKKYANFGDLLGGLDDFSDFNLNDEYAEDEDEAERQPQNAQAAINSVNNKNKHLISNIEGDNDSDDDDDDDDDFDDDFSSLVNDDDDLRDLARQNVAKKA